MGGKKIAKMLSCFIGYLCITDIANAGNNLPILKIPSLHYVMTLLLGFVSVMFWGSSQQCFRVHLNAVLH